MYNIQHHTKQALRNHENKCSWQLKLFKSLRSNQVTLTEHSSRFSTLIWTLQHFSTQFLYERLQHWHNCLHNFELITNWDTQSMWNYFVSCIVPLIFVCGDLHFRYDLFGVLYEHIFCDYVGRIKKQKQNRFKILNVITISNYSLSFPLGR